MLISQFKATSGLPKTALSATWACIGFGKPEFDGPGLTLAKSNILV
jgi:hypothetical protein